MTEWESLDILTARSDMEEMKFLLSGESALTLELSREISEEVNAKIRYLLEKISLEK